MNSTTKSLTDLAAIALVQAAIAALTISAAPTGCSKSNPTKAPEQAEKIMEQLEAMPNMNACGVFIAELRELYEGAGSECRDVLRRAMANGGGV
jgi:hypothetical protein